tara:strand:+ start:413 stop:715 length:303 start_codon:yes stop_codon:yes gene_type:complete
MEISKSTKTTLKFSNESSVSTYSRSWSNIIEIDFSEDGLGGVNNRYEIEMPVEKAEYLLESLTETIESFKEAKAAERAKKEAADKEAAEKLAVESEESQD